MNNTISENNMLIESINSTENPTEPVPVPSMKSDNSVATEPINRATTSNTVSSSIPQSAIPFWGTDPNVLFNKEHIFEFFPVETMTYEQKLNAITRLVILLTIISYIVNPNIRILLIFTVIMFSIYLLHESQTKNKLFNKNKKKEGFDTETDNTSINTPKQIGHILMKDIANNVTPPLTKSPVEDLFRERGIKMPSDDNTFDKSTPMNPLSNVLLSDYDYNPNKKPAPPSYVNSVKERINDNTKQMILDSLSPNQPESQKDLAQKLFHGLGENLEFEQSMRQFVSNPATTIPNDQGAFAEFLYGGMTSSKEGNQFSLARNLTHYTLY